MQSQIVMRSVGVGRPPAESGMVFGYGKSAVSGSRIGGYARIWQKAATVYLRRVSGESREGARRCEFRKPKAEARRKAEIRDPKQPVCVWGTRCSHEVTSEREREVPRLQGNSPALRRWRWQLRTSGFGLHSGFGPRSSDFICHPALHLAWRASVGESGL